MAIKEILHRVLKATVLGATKKVVVVDDGSVDETVKLIHEYISSIPRPKRSSRFTEAISIWKKIIQDGDLEYSP